MEWMIIGAAILAAIIIGRIANAAASRAVSFHNHKGTRVVLRSKAATVLRRRLPNQRIQRT